MRKALNLPDGTTLSELEWWASIFKYPIAVKLRKNLELWIEDGERK